MDPTAGYRIAASPLGSDRHDARPPTAFESRPIIDQVKEHFNRFSDAHSAITEHAVLLGVAGNGKAHIAKQAGEEITARDGRKLLCVGGSSYVTFVTDYYRIYEELTGESLPLGLTVPSALSKVQHTLETRRQEWLLILTNARPALEETFQLGRTPCPPYVLANFLPNRGHIISTSSEVFHLKAGKDGTLIFLSKLGCLKPTKIFHVRNVNPEGLAQYASIHYPRLPTLPPPFIKWCGRGSLLLLNLTAINLELLNLDFPAYFHFLRREIGSAATVVRKKSKQDYVIFNATMRILWNALAAHDRWAIRLLSAVSMVNPRSIPVPLLRMLPSFRDTVTERFKPALDMFIAFRLLTVQGDLDSDGTVSVHLSVWDWIHLHVPATNDLESCESLLCDWISVFDELMGAKPLAGSYSIQTYWRYFRHLESVLSIIADTHPTSPRFFCFLVKAAECIGNESQIPNWASGIVTSANNIWFRLQVRSPKIIPELDHMHVRLKNLSTQLSIAKPTPGLAERELSGARTALRKLGQDAPVELRREMEKVEVKLLMTREQWNQAEKLLYAILDDPEPDASIATIAKRHTTMAYILRSQGLEVSALCHSHEAMCCWLKFPEEEKWAVGSLHIVDTHAMLLLQVQKFAGALLFLPKLLEIWSDLIPFASLTVWRLAESLVRAYTRRDMLRAAEDVVCRMLEREAFEELAGDECMMYCLGMLYELAVLYMHYGRLIEAEAILRFVLQGATGGRIKDFFGQDRCPSEWWQELIVCLLLQRKSAAQKQIRRDYVAAGYSEETLSRRLRKVRRVYAEGLELYQQALWAEQEDRLDEWKLLLDSDTRYAGYRLAVRGFAHPRRRVREGKVELPDFDYDTDLCLVKWAKKSRVLHLLGKDLIYLCFANKGTMAEETAVDEAPGLSPKAKLEYWVHPSQHVLGEYWRWCECRRKRVRSGSINPVDIIDKRFLREVDAAEVKRAKKTKLVQKKLTDYVTGYKTTKKSKAPCPGDSCACIEGNRRAAQEWEEHQQRLWVWVDPREDHRPSASKLAKERTRYKASKSKVRSFPINEQFVEEERLIHIRTGKHTDAYDPTKRPSSFHWRWLQTEFEHMESDDEQYILSRALEVPTVIITTPEAEDDRLQMLDGVQQDISRYFQAIWEPPESRIPLAGGRAARTRAHDLWLEPVQEDAAV